MFSPPNFIQFVAKETPQYVSQWQSSNATHTMLTYFNFIKSYYGQTAYDNILQLYNNATRTYLDSFTLSEWHIYGNTRIGIYKIKRNLVAVKFTANETGGNFSETAYGSTSLTTFSTSLTTFSTSLTTCSAFFAQYEFNLFYLQRGNKHYELTNHGSASLTTSLGNVLTVITDKRLLSCMGDTVQSSFANIVSATDYSPFGAPLAGRTFSSEGYRFGFNSMERDDETYGEGNAYDFGSRIYDARKGRFLSIDPLSNIYPSYSPYNFAINVSIRLIDDNGEGPIDPRTWERKSSIIQITKDKIIIYATYLNGVGSTPPPINFPNYSFDADLLSTVLLIGVYKNSKSQMAPLFNGINDLFDVNKDPSKFEDVPKDRNGRISGNAGATYQVGGVLAAKDAALSGNYDYNEYHGNTLTLNRVSNGILTNIEEYTNLTWSGNYKLKSTTSFSIEYFVDRRIEKSGEKDIEVLTTYARVTETKKYSNRKKTESKVYVQKVSEEKKEN